MRIATPTKTNTAISIRSPSARRIVCTGGGGDCQDNNASVYPGAGELCNNLDDNCNGIIDENANTGCVIPPNATVGCVAAKCVILACSEQYYDLNNSYIDGCECNGVDANEPNDTCLTATVVATAAYDNGGVYTATGKVVKPNDDVDWFKFYAVDLADSGNGVCDKYNVRVQFVQTPGGLAFDISKGPKCPNANEDGKLANNFCCGQTDFNWFTNFKGVSNGDVSRKYSEFGQCPCTSNLLFYDQSSAGWNLDPFYNGPYCKGFKGNGVCFPQGFEYTRCQDDSAWYYIKVYKPAGAPLCAGYKLEISNGTYGSPGTGNGLK